MRRCVDVVGSALLLALLAPAWLAIGLVIKLESPGPVFVSQLRGGRSEKPFRLRKFRSMRDSLGPEENDPSGTRKERSMARTTRFGRILRRTSVDEVPQLVNVLCGHMSLIGPRPFVFSDLEDPAEIARATGRIEPEEFARWRRVRCQVRPGMTGLWQIKGRSSLPLEGLLRYDVEYVRRCSARFDLEILLKTIPAVVRGIGAF
ncbi:MAG: sugar transferase [Armatimonadota bacterium]|nr:MAG: sugar transferase [Armatimonadota bacterium]